MKFYNSCKKYGAKVSVLALSVVGTSVMAEDFTAKITEASTAANANQTAVITAILTLAAISFGVGMLVQWLRK
ncbi:hypothetical protein K6Y31_20905 [Motilimonas cestriensis]|uniref:Uncharacterized protein n=1 Tax=Motilimonas cestriensis TaxID=2742685 RepID=A0ABS8WGB4_9GAMM|nr:hypothetical protein [Motilimonas cestriensis]MCE2597237.1 hypothetical protein [Motilimonas cestriensis]